jgi:hypothetical protein
MRDRLARATGPGSGIVTSQTDATLSAHEPRRRTASQVKGITRNATAVWSGQTVTGSDTLVMYTYGGDANLDGKINIDDYGHIDTSVGVGLKWLVQRRFQLRRENQPSTTTGSSTSTSGCKAHRSQRT